MRAEIRLRSECANSPALNARMRKRIFFRIGSQGILGNHVADHHQGTLRELQFDEMVIARAKRRTISRFHK